MHCEIIPTAETHVESLHAAIDTVARERRYLAFLQAPPLDSAREFILNAIRRGDPHLVALVEGRVVGWADVTRHSREICTHGGTLGIGLLPGFRGQGIGRRLMRRVIDLAWDRGFTRIDLTVRESNVNAIGLYLSLGFEVEGLLRQAVRIDGAYENVKVMGLLKA